MQPIKTILAIVVVIILSLSAVIWFYPVTGDFRVDNPFWNGISMLNDKVQAIAVGSLSNLPPSGDGTALIMVPYEQYTDGELAQIRSYVSSGGVFVLLDDYGFGNQVLGGLGLNVEFTGDPLLDPLFNYRNKWLPKITDFEEGAVASNISSVVFNHPTTLSRVSDMDVIAYSSSFSFLDLNGNGVWDSGEPYGPFPVAAYTNFGKGFVVVVSDPSLFINGMLEMDDNFLFINNIIGLGGSNVQVFVDQSHLPQSAIDGSKAALGTIYGLIASPLGTLTLIVVVLALSLIPFWKRREKA